MTHLQGGESLFGDFVDWIQEVSGLDEGTAEIIASIAASISLLAALNLGRTTKWLASIAGSLLAIAGSSAAGAIKEITAAAGGAAVAGGGSVAATIGAGLLS